VYSARTRAPTSPNGFVAKIHALRVAGAPLLDLTVSNPTEVGLFTDNGWLTHLNKPTSARYCPEAFGLASARAAIASTYAARGLAVEPHQIVLCSSTSEAYSWLFTLLADPGDSILIPTPSYPLLDHLASFAGLRTRNYGIGYDGAYFIDTDSVRAALEPETRAVVLISPNNPTGSFTRRDELRALEQLSLPLISDEVFADYRLSSRPPDLPSVLDADAGLVFSLGGLSKSHAWPQLKLAWIVVAGPLELRMQALNRLEFIADTYLSVGTPVQEALPELIALGAERQARVLRRLKANFDALESLTRGSPVSVRPVQGGWSSVVGLPLTKPDDWATNLLVQQGVLVQPGWFYDFEDERLVVLSLLTPEAEFSEGVRRMVSAAV